VDRLRFCGSFWMMFFPRMIWSLEILKKKEEGEFVRFRVD
jgi:hypothetical protein